MTDSAARLAYIFDLVGELDAADRVRIAQQLHDRYVKGYGLLAPEPPLNAGLVRIHMDAATRRSALE